MNRNRRGFRDRDVGRRGGHDGLLGEGPGGGGGRGGGGGGGGMFDPIMNNQMNQMNQLMLAQQLLQKQAILSAGFGGGGGGGDLSALAGAMNNMQRMQQQQQLQHAMAGGFGGGSPRVGSGGGDHHHYRKRIGLQQDRDMDSKRRRRDSFGRSGDHDRFHGRDDNRSGEGRDRNRSSRWEPVEKSKDDRPKKKENEDYPEKKDNQDSLQKKEDQDYDPAEPTEDEEGQGKDRYCHVCNISVYDDASFRRHLNGTKHQARMNSVLTVHQMKSSQLQSRLKAEEHLRKIEGKAGGFDPDYFCKICNNELTIPWERHRFSNIHKQRQLQVKRGCGWCSVHDFNNFTEVLEHRETDEHKKNAEVHGKKPGEKKNEKPRSGSAYDRKSRPKKKEEEEDLTIPEFNAENPVGQIYIIPVTGFFCKLCNKFYNNEKSAKGAHCQTEGHYEKFKAALEIKIEAREAKRAEEAAAAAAAEAAEAERRAAEGEEEIGSDKDKDIEMEENQGLEYKGESQEEDYDDELPIEDSDDEGGLVKFIANNGEDEKEPDEMETTQTGEDSLLNETSANGSFTFLTGEEAEMHLQEQNAKENIAEAVVEAETEVAAAAELQAENGVGDEEDDTEVEDNSEKTPSESLVSVTSIESMTKEEPDQTAVENGSTDTNGLGEEGSSLSQEEEAQAELTPIAAAKPSRGRGTARRGRGRGRAKK